MKYTKGFKEELCIDTVRQLRCKYNNPDSLPPVTFKNLLESFNKVA